MIENIRIHFDDHVWIRGTLPTACDCKLEPLWRQYDRFKGLNRVTVRCSNPTDSYTIKMKLSVSHINTSMAKRVAHICNPSA